MRIRNRATQFQVIAPHDAPFEKRNFGNYYVNRFMLSVVAN